MTEPAVANPISGVTHQAVTAYTYDNAGRPRPVTVADAIGGDTTRTTTWTYDPAGPADLDAPTPDGAVTAPGVEHRR